MLTTLFPILTTHNHFTMTDSPDFEAPPTDLITLTRHILNRQHEIGEKASGDLTLLLVGIQVSTISETFRLRGTARKSTQREGA